MLNHCNDSRLNSAHILQDLQPYVCTYPECPDAEEMYGSRHAWLEHERLVHRRIWRCFEHASAVFKFKEGLQLHLVKCHTTLTQYQIDKLVDLAEASILDKREMCPFCHSKGPFPNGFYNHMAFHQEKLATFAIPGNLHENEDDASHSSKAQGIRSAGSLRSVSLDVSTSDADDNDHDDQSFIILEESIGREQQAKKLQMRRQALQERQKSLVPEHRDTLKIMDHLIRWRQGQGKYEEAEEMNERALQGRKKILGPDHPDTLISISNLALLLERQGKYEDAEEMNERVLQKREKMLRPDHPDTLISISNLAVLLERQGKYKKAEERNRRALQGSEKTLGPDHPQTLIRVERLASFLQGQGQYIESSILYERACAGFQKVLGSDHPNTLACAKDHKSMLQKLKEHPRTMKERMELRSAEL